MNAARALSMALIVALCGCGKRAEPSPQVQEVEMQNIGTDSLGYEITRTGPDKYGVICYSSNRSGYQFSCVKAADARSVFNP